MEDNKRLIVVDQNNQEIEMEILFTFDDENRGKKYVLYTNPNDESGEVFASSYDEEGKLFAVEDPTEWEMIEEVFGAYQDEFASEEA